MRIIFAILIASAFLIYGCKKKESQNSEFILNNALQNDQKISGFSFIKMNIITFPNSENIVPDFIVNCSINDLGIITKGPYLCHQDLEDRFILINSYDNITSAQNHFDTISSKSNEPYQTYTTDIKPFEIWQIKTSTEEIGMILIKEAKAENIEGLGYAEVKFKSKKFKP